MAAANRTVTDATVQMIADLRTYVEKQLDEHVKEANVRAESRHMEIVQLITGLREQTMRAPTKAPKSRAGSSTGAPVCPRNARAYFAQLWNASGSTLREEYADIIAILKNQKKYDMAIKTSDETLRETKIAGLVFDTLKSQADPTRAQNIQKMFETEVERLRSARGTPAAAASEDANPEAPTDDLVEAASSAAPAAPVAKSKAPARPRAPRRAAAMPADA